MKSKILTFLLIVFLLMFATLAIASISYTTRAPVNLFQTEDTFVNFSWTSASTTDSIFIPSYLYVTLSGDETNFTLNRTIKHCINDTACNVTVTGFVPGFYQWYIISGDDARRPSILSNNVYPYNTTAKNNITLHYTHNGTEFYCYVSLTQQEGLNSTDIANSLNSGCSYIFANTTSNTSAVNISVLDYGEDAFLRVVPTGNATAIVGLNNSNTSGTQVNSSTGNRWFEIFGSSSSGSKGFTHSYFIWKNSSGWIGMTLDKDTGDLATNGSLSIGSGTEWLSMYLSSGLGYLNSTVPIKFTHNVSIGTTDLPRNITMYSPDGTGYVCGVANGGAWSCQ